MVHIDESQAGGVTNLLKLPGVNAADLADVKIGIPRGQKGYPAFFIATASAKLSDGRTVYLVVRFSRASADQPWTVTQLRYDTDKLKVPVPGIDPDGYLKPTPPPGELVLDPATIAKVYAAWGTRVAASASLGTDPVLTVGAGDSFLRTTAANANVRAGHFFNTFAFTPGGAEPGLVLDDGTLLVRFTGKATEDLFNTPAPAAGSCDTGLGRFYVEFGMAGMPTGEFRKVHVDWSITAEARIPLKGGKPLGGQEAAGKALIQDSTFVASNPQSTPC
jgi:hypothetical protein